LAIDNLRQLHIIRGLAALYVAVGHAKVVFWSGGQEYLKAYPISSWSILDYISFGIDMMSSAAQEFVIVFFVLSGFFIAFSFEKNKWKTKEFILNRLVRISPPYLASVLLSIAVFLFIGQLFPEVFTMDSSKPIIKRMSQSYQELNIEAFLLSLLYLPKEDFIAGNLAYWSLLPEWIYYLIVPLLLIKRRIALLFFSLAFFANLIADWQFENHLLRFVFYYGFYFFFGMEVYSWITQKNWKKWLPKRWLSYSICLLLMFATILLGAIPEGKIGRFDSASLLFAAAFSVWSMMSLLKYPLSGKLYQLGVFLGDISYSLYVFHLPIYYLIYAFCIHYFETELYYDRIYWLMLPIAIFGSYLAYLLIEKRSLQYIKKLKSKR